MTKTSPPRLDPAEAPHSDSSSELHPLWAGVWLTFLIPLGLIPSVLFFAWIERNATLPVLPRMIEWPWVDGRAWPVGTQLLWNLGLFLTFGLLHSLLAQKKTQQALFARMPIQAHRAIYIIVTGLSLSGVAGLWQVTGIVLWSLPLAPETLIWFSPAVFWTLYGVGMTSLRGHGLLSFFGLFTLFQTREELLRPQANRPLVTQGLYAWVRHPLYTFTLASILIAPVMTLDRFWIFLSCLVYLRFGIPHEEKKLVAEWGDAYRRYQESTPALLPRLPFLRGRA